MDGTRSQSIDEAGSRKRRAKSLPISVIYLIMVGLLLVGYSFFNKGFAYVGYNPLYIGEIVLGVGIFAMLAGGGSLRFLRSPIIWALFLYVTWQVLVLIPGVSKFGFLALRDSVIWLYSLFAIFVSAALLRSRTVAKVPEWYFFFLPAWAIAAPFLFVLTEMFFQHIPRYPGSDIPIIWLKAGDMGVQIGGAAAFLMLGLHKQFRQSISRHASAQETYVWLFLLIGLIACGSRNRGGLFAALCACGVVTLFKPINRLTKLLLPMIIVVMILLVVDLRVPVGGERYISLNQIYDNLSSVFFKSNKHELAGTEKWRLSWWTEIINDTVYGDNFWTGVGYGKSLAKLDGFADATGNRSPHNGHLTILSRSGVPGFALWLTLLATILFSLLRAIFAARAAGQTVVANLSIWVLGFFVAFLVNTSVDVFLEGPQGGIWFWCLVGYAIALTEERPSLSVRDAASPRRAPRGTTPVRRAA